MRKLIRPLRNPVSIASRLRGAVPRFPYEEIRNAVLGSAYELSIAYVGVRRMATINARYRGKKGATDVLSFPLGKNAGEIVLCPEYAARKARSFGDTPRRYLGRILIHGCAHLKGYSHGGRMDEYEDRIRARFIG